MLARFEEDRPRALRGPKLTALLITFALVAGACSPSGGGSPSAPPQACEAAGSAAGADLQIPATEAGKFNVAMVLIGPHDDGGWSQAHYEGLLEVEKNVPDTHVAYIEFVPEGADSEQVFRSLARRGGGLLFGAL